MNLVRLCLLLLCLMHIVSAEITIHIYNPWIDDPYRQDSIYIIGNNEVGYHPGKKMKFEGNGWFYYTFNSTVTASDNIKFRSYIGNIYDPYAKRLEFTSTGNGIPIASIKTEHPGATEIWIVPSGTANKYEVFTVPPEGKVIHILNPWPDNSPQIVVGRNAARKMIINTTYCGWYTYFFAGNLDSLQKVYFTDYYHKYKYSADGMKDGALFDLSKFLADKDTIYILPKPFPNGLPSISATFPGKTGECPVRQVSAMIRDWKQDGISFFASGTGGKITLGMVAKKLGADGKPVKAANLETGKATAMETWFSTVNNNQTCIDLTLTKGYDGRWEYDSDLYGGFFPIDTFNHENNIKYEDVNKRQRNFHFTMEMHLQFIYHKGSGQVFIFRGDDDVWIFVNDQLAIDLGGMHEPLADTLEMDRMAATLGLVDEGNYKMDIFFAERQPINSNFLIKTSLDLRNSEDLFYKEKTLKPGNVRYDIMQMRGVEGLQCGFTPLMNEEESAVVDFFLDGPLFQGQGVQLNTGTNYGGIIVDNNKSTITIDSAAIKDLTPGLYTITFISTFNKSRSGFLTFTVGGKLPGSLSADPPDGTHFFGDTLVQLFTEEGARIYFTTDGSKPDTNNNSQLYTQPVKLTWSATIKAIAVGEKYLPASASWSYFRDLPNATLDAFPGDNTHFGDSIIIKLITDADKIYFTTDGSDPVPGNQSQLYSSSITIYSDTVILKAIAVGDEFNSTKKQWMYISDRISNVFANPPGHEFVNNVTVSLMVREADAVIYYTLDGSEPTINSTKYTEALEFNSTIRLRARAFAPDKVPSSILDQTYIRSVVVKNALYYDVNADGCIDSFVAALDYQASSAPDTLILQNPYLGSEKVLLKAEQIQFSDNNNTLTARVEPPFSYNLSTGFFAGPYARFMSKGFSRDPFSVQDRVAPLITEIIFAPDIFMENNPDGFGKLTVAFSENIEEVSNSKPFIYDQKGTPYTLDLTLLSQSGKQAKFRVNSIQGIDFPEQDDSVNIAITGRISDEVGNIQENPKNRKVPLRVLPQQYSIIFSVFPNPFVPGNTKILEPAKELTITDGVTIVADFRGNLKTKIDKIKAEIEIYDNIGNLVCKNNQMKATDSPVQFAVVQSQRTMVVFHWNARNHARRMVGKGTYMAIVKITDPSEMVTLQRIFIGVK